MFNVPPTLQRVIDQLISEKYIVAEAETTMAGALTASDTDIGTPWYIRALVGLSGWFAAIFFVGFLFVTDIATSEIGAVITGLIFCGVAVGLRRMIAQSVFTSQMTLALSLAGQILFIFGIGQLTDSIPLTAAFTIILEGVLIALYQDKLHRFISGLVIAGAVLVLFVELDIETMIHIFVIILAIGTVQLWMHESFLATTQAAQLYRPVGYSIPVAMFGILCISLTNELDIYRWWISGIGLLVVLFYLEYLLLSHYKLSLLTHKVAWLFGGTVLLIIPAYQAPGIVAAIIVLLLAFQRGNRLLMGLAAAFLALFLVGYYYSLEIDLLTKSAILMGTGLVCLALRYILARKVELFEVTL